MRSIYTVGTTKTVARTNVRLVDKRPYL